MEIKEATEYFEKQYDMLDDNENASVEDKIKMIVIGKILELLGILKQD